MAMLPVLSVSYAFFFLTRNVRAAFLMFMIFPMSLEVTLYCGERREEKINDQLWDYSVINRIPFISELSTVRYWK